ncbi:CDP-alcohol phosphatidyltransferase family protein [Peristeroidobacter agariperforans]|uniref:CDP-alcohol phosphatidyltransferase family protein n=1 Tax=Peristeroidobacter agariperforans TaxID=268404 RepID=UPI00101D00DC|nr:CDP-alcohol phosphatidyltransferase family protein [Peristeroidobacter agariperforans]
MPSADTESVANRRPLSSRSTGWARFLTAALLRAGISPNAISVISVVFAAAGVGLLYRWPNAGGLLAFALCIQLRLLCNLLDGMVAIEGKRQSPTGALFNEVPDRLADSLFIVALGYAIDAPVLGWFGALAAAITAYIRVLGGSLGLPQDFRGPMAKPHRMAVLTVACVLGALEWWMWQTQWALSVAAWIVAVGSVITCITRLAAIARQLRAR